jgi:hypothetical protein
MHVLSQVLVLGQNFDYLVPDRVQLFEKVLLNGEYDSFNNQKLS